MRRLKHHLEHRSQHSIRRLGVVLSLLVPSLVACAAQEEAYTIKTVFDPCAPLVLVPDGGLERDEVEDIAEGIGLWNGLVGSRLTLDEVEGAPRLPIRFEQAAAPIFGHYDDEEALVHVNETLARDQRVIVLAHEVGHAFGLLHVDAEDRASVMNHGNRDIVPNSSDAAALAAMWGSCGS